MPRFFILRQGFWYKAWALSAAREGRALRHSSNQLQGVVHE
jgi:hypothetical protein